VSAATVKRLVPRGLKQRKAAIQWKLYERRCPVTREAVGIVSRGALVASLHVSREHRFVYVDNAKSGSTSFKSGLVRFVTGDDDVHGPHHEARRLFSDVTELPTLRPLGWLIDHDYKFISFVRDPYERLASSYRFVYRSHPSKIRDRLDLDPASTTFSDFVRAVSAQDDKHADSHWRSQSAQLAFGVIPYSFIGRSESMNEDWYRAYDAIGVARDRVPRPVELNRSEGVSEWTDELRELARIRYADDFRNFGYTP
jgi:hypothetical protein